MELPYLRGMKAAISLICLLALAACKKDDDIRPNEPTLPISRQLLVNFSVGDTSNVDVYRSSLVWPKYEWHWTGVGNGWYALSFTPGSTIAGVYRTDTIMFECHVTEASDMSIRLDDIPQGSVHLDPSQNGQEVYRFVPNW
jgi:hypothetical protein